MPMLISVLSASDTNPARRAGSDPAPPNGASTARHRPTTTAWTSATSTNAPTKSHGRFLNVSQPKRRAKLGENPIGGRIAHGNPKLTGNLNIPDSRPEDSPGLRRKDRRARVAPNYPGGVSTLQCRFSSRYHALAWW